MHHPIAVFVALLPWLQPVLPAQGEVDARSPASKGSSAWLVYESTMDATAEMRGQAFETQETIVWTLHLQVTDVDGEGNCLVSTKVVRARGKLVLAAEQGEAAFDSASEADGAGSPIAQRAAKVFTDAVGKTFACRVSPRGQVLEFGEGTKALVGGEAHRGSMHACDEAQLRQWVEGAFGIVPQKRTAGGAKWNRTANETVGNLPTRQQLASTLTVVDPEFFEIESVGTLEVDREAAAALEKKENETNIGQLETTKVTSSKITARQKTSRRDGFVLTAQRTVAAEFVSSDARMGDMTAKCTTTTAISRTSEAQALARPGKAAEAAATPAGKAK